MTTADEIALGAALVSLVAMLSTAGLTFANYRLERLNQRMQFNKLQQDYFATLRVWADQVSDLLSEAIHFSELDPKRCPDEAFFERRNMIRISLSSYIDRGRWFFPNLHTDRHGQDKEVAFRGYRPEILNSLVAAYLEVTALDYKIQSKNTPYRDKLVAAKRAFVSEVQGILDPVRRDEEFKEITKAVIEARVPLLVKHDSV